MSSPILETATPAATLVAVDGRTYPLESARIIARAEGGIATTTLAQAYANPHDEPLEVTYTLPLPADGAVLGYTIRMGETVIRGEVQPREKAAQAYRDALFEGRTAGLLEQTRTDTFQQKLGNVPAKTRVEITIDVLHPLAFGLGGESHAIGDSLEGRGDIDPARVTNHGHDGGPTWEYRFPTVVGVRYHGAPGRTPDQAELSPDRDCDAGIPTRVELALTIADADFGLVHSPSHALRVEAGEHGAVVSFDGGERLDRDVVIRWAAATGAVGAHAVEGGGLAGDDGRYALVTIVPPATPGATLARDLTVLIDASGSMSGMPLDLARRVVGELLRSLGGNDRFELLAFASDVRRLTRPLVKVTAPNVAGALEALATLQAGGATEMAHAITEALRPARSEAQRQVVLVTDGDISFESEVVGRIADSGNVRLHVVGVGSAPNRALTQQAAAAGRGLELLAGDPATAAEAARRLVAGTASPVLTGVGVRGTALTGERPGRLRDVFAGQPLVITVELSRQGGTLELRGDLAGPGGPWQEIITVPAAGGAGALRTTPLPVGALHGRSRVAELEIALACTGRGDVAAIEHHIESLGMRHRIASRATSLVAIAETPSVDPREPRRRERLAVEVPAGVSAEGAGLGWGSGDALSIADCAVQSTSRSMPMFPGMYRPGRAAGGARRGYAPFGDLSSVSDPYPGSPLAVDQLRWLEPGLLVIEFAVPVEGMRLHDGPIAVRWTGPDGHAIDARGRVDSALSSRPGPHAAGLVVRLVIRLDAPYEWPAALEVSLEWQAGLASSRVELPMHATLRIPDAPESGSPGAGR